jgi:hypothetical protein
MDGCWPSWAVLLFGWLGMAKLSNIAWLANIFIFVSWRNIVMKNKIYAIFYSILSIIFTLIFIVTYKDNSGVGGDLRMDITTINIGYYLWLASAVAAFIGSLFVRPNPPHLEKVDVG